MRDQVYPQNQYAFMDDSKSYKTSEFKLVKNDSSSSLASNMSGLTLNDTQPSYQKTNYITSTSGVYGGGYCMAGRYY